MTEYWFVALDVIEGDAEEIGASLFELGATGVEQRDAGTLLRGAEGAITLIASFESRADAEAGLAAIDSSMHPRLERIEGDAWRDEYKKYFHPFRITKGIVIRPPWEECTPEPGEKVLVLEPGRAFGTGLHETTALVADVVSSRDLAGIDVLDVGCGSGILALIALALGAKSARAIDNDPDAVTTALENAARNQMTLTTDTTDIATLAGTWPLVLANIEARVLIAMASHLTARTSGDLVLSGILTHQADDVVAAYSALTLKEKQTKGEWVALVMTKGG